MSGAGQMLSFHPAAHAGKVYLLVNEGATVMKLHIGEFMRVQLLGVSQYAKYNTKHVVKDVGIRYSSIDRCEWICSQHEKRKTLRKGVSIDSVVRIEKGYNDIFYTAAIVKNISLCGMRLEVHSKSIDEHSGMEHIRNIDVVLKFPSGCEVLIFKCDVRYVEISGVMVVGAEFVLPDEVTLRHVVRFLLTSSCQKVSRLDTCRSSLQMSGFPTGVPV